MNDADLEKYMGKACAVTLKTFEERIGRLVQLPGGRYRVRCLDGSMEAVKDLGYFSADQVLLIRMVYAFNEFTELASKLPKNTGIAIDTNDPIVRYLCALVAELAYHYVPAFEIDDGKRGIVLPCDAYNLIVARLLLEQQGRDNVAERLHAFLGDMRLEEVFFIDDDPNAGSIAAAVAVRDLLFIGFRGTTVLFDKLIDIKVRLVPGLPINVRFGRKGTFHRGFASEASRISRVINEKIGPKGPFRQIFLSGHSLGGAVAALSNRLITVESPHMSTCIFGSPRYCDLRAYRADPNPPPVQVERPNDKVPYIPPVSWGYASHPNRFNTSGRQLECPTMADPELFNPSTWWFLANHRPHNMELYRRDLGVPAGASPLAEELTPLPMWGT